MYYMDLPDKKEFLKLKMTLGSDKVNYNESDKYVQFRKDCGYTFRLVDMDTHEVLKKSFSEVCELCSGTHSLVVNVFDYTHDSIGAFKMDCLVPDGHLNYLFRHSRVISDGYCMTSGNSLYYNGEKVKNCLHYGILAIGSDGKSLLVRSTVSITETKSGSVERIKIKLVRSGVVERIEIVDIYNDEDLYKNKIGVVNDMLESIKYKE